MYIVLFSWVSIMLLHYFPFGKVAAYMSDEIWDLQTTEDS